MKTVIKLYREHADAYMEYSQFARENFNKKKFRMYATTMSVDVDGVKYIYTSFEDMGKQVLPEGEDVVLNVECLLNEQERLMLTRRWVIV